MQYIATTQALLRTVRGFFLGGALLALSGCASTHGEYVWIDQYPQSSPQTGELQLGVGDLVNVQVWENDKLSTKARIREDGRLAMPLVGEVIAAGKSPRNLATEIEHALQDQKYILTPRVTIVVEEVQSLKISVLGAVVRAGIYVLDGNSGVVTALASAGGLTEFAHKDRIFVLRGGQSPRRIRFTFDELTEVGRAASFRLQPGDVVVAE
jgi:polysaccharide export outer membrane protein